jgi:hypothetical protein
MLIPGRLRPATTRPYRGPKRARLVEPHQPIAVLGLRKRLRPHLLIFVLVAGLALPSCVGSGYTYVSSTSTGTFFKVPDS